MDKTTVALTVGSAKIASDTDLTKPFTVEFAPHAAGVESNSGATTLFVSGQLKTLDGTVLAINVYKPIPKSDRRTKAKAA